MAPREWIFPFLYDMNEIFRSIAHKYAQWTTHNTDSRTRLGMTMGQKYMDISTECDAAGILLMDLQVTRDADRRDE